MIWEMILENEDNAILGANFEDNVLFFVVQSDTVMSSQNIKEMLLF